MFRNGLFGRASRAIPIRPTCSLWRLKSTSSHPPKRDPRSTTTPRSAPGSFRQRAFALSSSILVELCSRRNLVFAAASLISLHIFLETAYTFGHCSGISMLPTFNSFGDIVIIASYYRHGRGIEVGDLVSYAHPVLQGVTGIKWVLGMPGDFVLRDTPGVGDGKMIQVPPGHCWIVGDNLSYSRDSRMFGPLPLALVKGKVVLRRPAPGGGGQGWFNFERLHAFVEGDNDVD